MRTKTLTKTEARRLDRLGYKIVGMTLSQRRRKNKRTGKYRLVPVLTISVEPPRHV